MQKVACALTPSEAPRTQNAPLGRGSSLWNMVRNHKNESRRKEVPRVPQELESHSRLLMRHVCHTFGESLPVVRARETWPDLTEPGVSLRVRLR